MGACEFIQTAIGKDLQDAYKKACERALDYYGHQEGYNGTISTTSGVRLYTKSVGELKAEIKARLERARTDLAWQKKAAKQWKKGSRERLHHERKADERRCEVEDLRRAKQSLKADARAMAQALLDMGVCEKREAAWAIEVKGKRAREIKERMGMKGKRVKVFVLFGMAAE